MITLIGILSAQVAPYMAESIGEDFYGLMDNNTNQAYEFLGYDGEGNNIGLDQAWIKLANMFGSNWDLSLGRQEIKLEKLFLISDGDDQGTAYWCYFRNSFPLSIKLDGNLGNLKTTFFWAQSGKYIKDSFEEDVDVYGLNLHYDVNDMVYVYGGIFQKDEPSFSKSSTAPFDEFENDTLNYDIGVDITYGKFLLEGEFVYQTGDVLDSVGNDYDRDSMAYWGSATYKIPVEMSPYIRGMYLYFSGENDDLEDGDVDNYDPMFSGFGEWNRWVVGEMVGEAQLSNCNKENFIMEIGFAPLESMNLSLMYIQHKLLESSGSSDWADEVNLFMDYFVGDNLYLHVGLGYASPGEAAEITYGNNEEAFFSQFLAQFYF